MIREILFDMIRYFKGDARRINHAIKVYGFASTICALENISGIKKDVIEISAVLHDIGIKAAFRKYNSTAGNYQEIEGPPIARRILVERNVSNEIIDRVCFLVGNHHSCQKVDDIDFQILVEADFIVNIFEDNVDAGSVYAVKEKYFKTNSGKEILDTIYGNKDS